MVGVPGRGANMEMQQIRYFLALCETLNFTRAAEQCNVSQPSLTRAIGNLEQEMGGELFRRERRQTHLTELGRLVQRHLENLQASARAAEAEARKYLNVEQARLRLGMMCTIGPARIVGFLRRLHADLPGINVDVREAIGTRLVENLMEGKLDVAVIGLPGYPDRLDSVALYEERYVIGFGSGHHFEKLNAVPLASLNGEDYVQRQNCEFSSFREALGSPNVDPNIVYASEREVWVQAMLASGVGCAVMPESMPVLPGIATRPLIEPEVVRTISLVTVAGRQYSPALREVISAARRHDWSGWA